MGITNSDSLTDANQGIPYGPEQLLATGGTAPFTFASSDLPAGFSLSSSGVLTSDATTTQGDYTFSVTLTDGNGGECVQTVSIKVVVTCATSFADLVWTITSQSLVGANPTWSASAAGASGVFSIQLDSPPASPEQLFEINYESTFCNGTAFPIPITFTIPVDAAGAVGFGVGCATHWVVVRLSINGVFQDSENRDLILFFPPPQVMVVTANLPPMTTCNILFEVVMQCCPAPSVVAFSNPSWTIT